MKEFTCPLCGSARTVEVESHDAVAMARAYEDRFGVLVRKFFPEDRFSTLKCVECGLRSHFPSLPGDSDFYDQMQRHAFYYEEDKPEFSYALKKIIETKPSTVLEIGCGAGFFLRKLKSAYDVSAVEYSERSLQTLRDAGIKIDDGGRQYDLVMFFQVLEHVPDVRGFVANAVSKVKEGGHLLVTVPNSDSRYMQEGGSSILDFPPHHLTQWPRSALEAIAGLYGLQLVDYYSEPIRIEHLMGIMSSRRSRISGRGVLSYFSMKFGRLLDRIFVPYLFEKSQVSGHTHGALFRKSRSQQV